MDATQDCGNISAENLSKYAAVIFYTTGELQSSRVPVIVASSLGGAAPAYVG